MTALRSAPKGAFDALADIPGSVAAGAFLVARETGGRSAGTGIGLFVFAAAHVTLFTLFVGESLIRRIAG